MNAAIVGVTGALIFYSVAIWSEQILGALKKWIIIIFVWGFCFDLFGTSQMYVLSQHHTFSFHTVAGYLALIFMCLHLLWALLVFCKSKQNQQYMYYFHKGSRYAWFVWLVAFISGIPW